MSLFARRIAEVRRDLFGGEGVLALSDSLGLPSRTWANSETGVTMPAPVLLRFIDLTDVMTRWLLTGEGPKSRRPTRGSRRGAPPSEDANP